MSAEADARFRLMSLARLGARQLATGESTSDPAWLAAAVDTYRAALACGTPGTEDWARMQRNLGAALCLLGRLTDDPGALAEAVAHDRAAAAAYAPGSLDWAMTQNNLADALRVLGERTGESEALEASIEACRAALTVTTREAFPRDWAMTSTNLANALAALGGEARLAEAMALYRAALEAVDDPQITPAIRYNLARAERRLGLAPSA
jgi:tetratricopeptide (TPR) repeat protein